jgi:hypothetical protein
MLVLTIVGQVYKYLKVNIMKAKTIIALVKAMQEIKKFLLIRI